MLNLRQESILKSIVEKYIQFNKPIGSVDICNDLDLSSATVRNEMAFLEKKGLLNKQYNTAGRIPEAKGYRYYVDNIMKPDTELHAIKLKLSKVLNNRLLSIDEIVENSCKIISDTINVATLTHKDISNKEVLKKVDLIVTSQNTCVILVVTDTGNIIHKKLKAPKNDLNFNLDDLNKCVTFLNRYLVNTKICDIENKIHSLSKIAQQFYTEHELVIQRLINLILNNVTPSNNITGMNNIIKREEYHDHEKLTKLVNFLEKKSIWEIIESTYLKNHDKVDVKIGKEISKGIKDIATITSFYKNAENGAEGSITLCGPQRLEYKKLVGLLNWLIDKIESL